jgi:hypothetical protein
MRAARVAGACLLSAAGLTSGAASADEVFLVGGGRIVGEVVEQRAGAVVVEVGAGRVTLPAYRVSRIASGRSPLTVYRERAARLAPQDARGWLELGFWARDNDLLTLAREAFERVAAVDPTSEAAHRALGHVRLDGQWMSEDEGYRARGYVQFEGAWMTPQQAQLVTQQRAAEAAARSVEREAQVREREAEARARAAEAEAARAAAEAQAAAGSGIPYPWVFGPSYGPGYGPTYGPFVPAGGVVGPRVKPHHPRRDRSAPSPDRASDAPRVTPQRDTPPPRRACGTGTRRGS